MRELEVGQRWRHDVFDVDRVIIGLNTGINGETVVTWYTDLGTDDSGEPYEMRDGYFSGYYSQPQDIFDLSSEYLVS